MAASGLARLLVNEGIITKSDARTLKEVSGSKPYSFAKALIAIGLFDDEQLTEFVAEFGDYERAPKNLSEEVDRQALMKMSKGMVKHLMAIPIKSESKMLVVAVPDPLDFAVTERIRFFLGTSIKPVVAPFAEIRTTLFQLYGEISESTSGFEAFLNNFGETAVASLYRRKNPEVEALQDIFGTNVETLADVRSGASVTRRDDVEFSSIDEIDFGDLGSDTSPMSVNTASKSDFGMGPPTSRQSASYETDSETDEFVFDESDGIVDGIVDPKVSSAVSQTLVGTDLNFGSDDEFEGTELNIASQDDAIELPEVSEPVGAAAGKEEISEPELSDIDLEASGGDILLEDLSEPMDDPLSTDIKVSDSSLESSFSEANAVEESNQVEKDSFDLEGFDAPELTDTMDQLALEEEESLSENKSLSDPEGSLSEEANFDIVEESIRADETGSQSAPSDFGSGVSADLLSDENDTAQKVFEQNAPTPRPVSGLAPTLLAKLSLVNLKLSTVLDLERAVAIIEKELIGELILGLHLTYIDSRGLDGELGMGDSASLADKPRPQAFEGYFIEPEDQLTRGPGATGKSVTTIFFSIQDSKDDELGCWVTVKGQVQPQLIVDNLQRTLRRLSRHFA